MSYKGCINRVSKEEQDLYDIKNAAAEFYRVNRVPQEMEKALNELFLHKPEDVHGYLVGVPELYYVNCSLRRYGS